MAEPKLTPRLGRVEDPLTGHPYDLQAIEDKLDRLLFLLDPLAHFTHFTATDAKKQIQDYLSREDSLAAAAAIDLGEPKVCPGCELVHDFGDPCPTRLAGGVRRPALDDPDG